METDNTSDVVVVGAGIVGLACALVAVEQGLTVQVVEREPFCIGASIRNFGLLTVTGQAGGVTWQRAHRTREIWAHIAPQARIPLEHHGLYVLAQRSEAEAVLRELMLSEQGAALDWLPQDKLSRQAPHLAHAHVRGALYSPHELRVEARFAIERLRLWLATRGVRFHMGLAVRQVESGRIYLDDRELKGERIVVCPGADLRSLFAKTFSRFNTRLCQLQMLRIRPPDGYVLGAAVMSDLSLVRYPGFRNTPGAGRLEDRLRQELPRSFQYGVHLIVVQNTDGSLVVGDSHQYGDSISPFESTEAEELILAEMQRVLCLGHYAVLERWTGIYPSGSQDAFIEAVLPGVQLLSVTSGTGMSTAFALAEECLMGERISI